MHLEGKEKDAVNHAGERVLRGLGFLSLEMKILEGEQEVEVVFESSLYVISSSHRFPLSFATFLFLPLSPSSLKLFPNIAMFQFGSLTLV